MVRTSALASDKLFIGKLRFHEILEVGTSDTGRGDERAAGRRKDVALVAVRDDKPLTTQFYVEGCASFADGCLERRSIEVLVFTLRTLARDVESPHVLLRRLSARAG